jgi:chromosome partitioning protein
MTRILAIANQKGGVGKTSTSASLSGALARRGFDVLSVDLDAQANLTLALGLDPERLHGSTADIFLNSLSLSAIACETGIPFLSIAPANSELELVERFLPVRQNFELLLKAALDGDFGYDFLILDCPPSMGAVTLNALAAAHLLVIPTQPEFFSAHALRSMMASVQRVQNQYNPGLKYKILMTMLDRRNRIHRQLSEQIGLAFKDCLFNTVIEIDTKLRESAVAGLPITHFKAATRSAQQYEALAQELIEYVQEKQPTPAR